MPELILGISLGWAAGISPGPLSTLVLLTALRRGFAAGARVAVAPLLTDGIVVPVCLLAIEALPDGAVTGLTVAGAAYLLYLGASSFREAGRPPTGGEAVGPRTVDLRRGFLTNLLSPHPWIFWVAVGGPILADAWDRSPVAGMGFLVGFFVLLVGTKLGLAALAAGGRRIVSERWYAVAGRIGGVLLSAMGVILLASAFRT